MIDKILRSLATNRWFSDILSDAHDHALQAALTAIYEIGLECIGAAEQTEYGSVVANINNEKLDKLIRNDLRASQRKAWAKACGVAEK